jgi:hypothetical protein
MIEPAGKDRKSRTDVDARGLKQGPSGAVGPLRLLPGDMGSSTLTEFAVRQAERIQES